MSQWKVKSPALLILSGLVCAMLLIVVLPDVDLPDTAFHQGTAPLVVHARANAAPPVVAMVTLLHFPEFHQSWYLDRDREDFNGNLDPNFRPILLRSIRR
jgi:hypothetical protein